MQSPRRWRMAAIIAPPILVLAAATIVACRDAATSSQTPYEQSPARVTPMLQRSVAGIEARRSLSERNAQDWVGIEHNRALDDIRKEMRRPGVLTHNLCDFALNFVTSPHRLPTGKRNATSNRQVALAGAPATPFCRGQTASIRNASLGGFESEVAGMQESEVSSAIYGLLSEVQNAVDAATDRYDLASRLNRVLDAAATLQATEQEMLGATVSVAQNSFEYWESELPAFEQELWNEYSTCAAQYRDSGASSEDARIACLEGGTRATSAGSSRVGAATVATFTSFGISRACGLAPHFKRLAAVDAVAALGGAIKGGLVAGPAGILPGAFSAAAYASFGSFVTSTWALYWCAMPK